MNNIFNFLDLHSWKEQVDKVLKNETSNLSFFVFHPQYKMAAEMPI